jgi:hypothetical protein
MACIRYDMDVRDLPISRRAARAFTAFLGLLIVLVLLMSLEIWWIDAAYITVSTLAMLAFSVRALVARWRSDDSRDVTKHGPSAAYPASWRRWYTDDFPTEDNRR